MPVYSALLQESIIPEKNYKESIKWFKRAKNYCRSEYSDEIYENELKRHWIEEGLFKARQARKEDRINQTRKIFSILFKTFKKR